MKKIKAALVGVGSMGRGHLDNYIRFLKEDYPIEIVALCDIDEKKFTNYKADFNLGAVGADGYDFSKFRLYTDLDDMLEKEKELDMITIALPTYLHCEATVKCLNKGINVLCEKPMAMSVEECDLMINTAKKNNVRLMIGQCLRFAGAYEALKKYVVDKTFGEVVGAYFFRGGNTPLWSYNNWLLDRSKGGGALFDQHVHDIDAVNYIFGIPNAVTTLGHTSFEKSAYDNVTTNYFFDSGIPINTQNDWTLSGNNFYQIFRVNFENGTIMFGSDGFKVFHRDGTLETPEIEKESPYFREASYFANCILEDKPITHIPPETSRETIRIALAEMKSADNGGAKTDVK